MAQFLINFGKSRRNMAGEYVGRTGQSPSKQGLSERNGSGGTSYAIDIIVDGSPTYH
jgi:hypothetical protein